MTTRKINGNTYSEFAIVAAEPIPVDIQGATLTLDADGVEIKNDVGHPIPVSDAGGSITVDGPLTDTELRATAVPVSGPLTDTELRATALPVSAAALPLPSGAATEAKQDTLIGHVDGVEALLTTIDADTGSIDGKLPALSGGKVPVVGPLTDTELRATAVPVSGPLTDAELRATAVPVSAAALPLPTGAATEAKQDTGNTSLGNIDADLGAPADAAASSDTGTFGLIALIKRGLQNWTTLLGRVPANLTVTSTRLLVDGSGVTQPTSVALRTPTTASITSSASSVTILAANADRRGLSIANDSTSVLRLSFATPATSANAFIVMQPGSFLWLDQQLMITGAIYGIWASANGTAQVTEYV